MEFTMTKELINYNNFGDLKVRKYAREVFYDNLWNTDPLLLESRGHVLNENDELVARPFKKVFNYKENGTTVDLETNIVLVEKINGFMFHVTKHKDFIIEGTTGSLNSPFTKLAKENMTKHNVNYDGFDHILNLCGEVVTCIFEIKDNTNDPHIIDDEEDGVYLLGIRAVASGKLLPQEKLDVFAKVLNVKRPNWEICLFKDALKQVEYVRHEGFVVYDFHTDEAILKLKSPYYISKKSLMRKHPNTVYNPDYRKLVDEEYYPIIEKIKEVFTIHEWAVMNEQDRGEAFNIIYKAFMLSVEDKIKYISNHPKLSFHFYDDVVKVSYDIKSDSFVSCVDIYDFDRKEMHLVKLDELKSFGKNFEESITNLYISTFTKLGEYDYRDDFSLEPSANIEYFREIIKMATKQIESKIKDIEYYCK